MTTTKKIVSIILPVHNEKGNLSELKKEIDETMGILDYEYEVIWVDDRSTDGSFDLLQNFAKEAHHHRTLRLKRNMGQTQAIAAGFRASKGSVIVFLDADGQNPPSSIPRLLEKLKEGWSVVSGWREERKDGILLRKIPSLCANYLISKLMGFRIRDYGCALKAYKRKYLEDVLFLGDAHRLLLAYAHLNGATICEVPVGHRPRTTGKSHYGLGRTIKVILDMLILRFSASYSTKPAHFFGFFGVAMTFFSFIILAFVFVRYFFVGLWISPMILIGFGALFTGFQLIVLSLAVEVLYRRIEQLHPPRSTLIDYDSVNNDEIEE